jgi:hypothetical protein
MDDQTPYRPLNRRTFLRMSGAFALLAGLGGKRGAFAASGQTPRRTLADLHFADFAALLGHTFAVYTTAATPQWVALAAVKQRTPVPATAGREWFSLAFCGSKGQTFPQGTYTFAHPSLGQFDLFVVPTMAVDHEERHIAIINRI